MHHHNCRRRAATSLSLYWRRSECMNAGKSNVGRRAQIFESARPYSKFAQRRQSIVTFPPSALGKFALRRNLPAGIRENRTFARRRVHDTSSHINNALELAAG